MLDLYGVNTIVKEYGGCRNVLFIWLRSGKSNRPYAELIENYDPQDPYAESAIDELFTADEANALKDYLDQHHGGEGSTTITKADLPIPNNVVGLDCIGVGGGNDFYSLYKEPEYSLPFMIEGYFNLVGCELIDEPGETFRHYIFLAMVDKDGCVADFRKETQAEVRLREAEEAARRERDQAGAA